ncbi:hypothetical protein HCX48_06765 [Rhodocyclus tenuis]|uniref:DUF3551 domain-containing protein n=1 Tax=Rhodocyclus gracilis TaxID=2929842 RepID=A0ABX0WGS3_9RHOO|nr:hypothetical protein [Rhodocyclus gracilis]MRD74163.1 hypothetical protein [Rhodocyclus gracilis]NJA88919.1 hypothetical protein [Rhodocyclus gracilis]
MSAGGWGCPHEVNDRCNKVALRACDPGMKGCVLAGRYAFFNDEKNTRLRNARQPDAALPEISPKGLRPDAPDTSSDA